MMLNNHFLCLTNMRTMAGYSLIFLAVLALSGHTASQAPDATFTFNEELPLSTQVGNISDVPGLFPELSEQDKQSLEYGILSQANFPGSLFNVSRAGGIIYVAQRIDREAWCLVEKACVLKINVLASSQISSQFDSKVITVHLIINDINDNAPTFEQDHVVLKVSERNSIDSVLKLSGANDRDYRPEYKVKNYTLNSFRDVFELTASQALDGSSEIDLKLKEALDRETVDNYEFTITAYDGGSPPKSSTLLVTVDVTDVNDNEPVFLNDTYSVTLDGVIPLNQVIVRVSATDADEGNNGLVTYDFSNLQKAVLESKFHINSSTGEISVVGPLPAGLSEFIVEAQDSGNLPLKTQTVVRVNVFNTVNRPPHVSINTVGANSDSNVVWVQEPAGRGLFVAFVEVNDDGGGDVFCEVSNEVFRMEPVPTKGYTIVLQGTVDRETRAAYNLTVICMDKGEPPLTSTATVTVKIKDANDNSPEFTQSSYSRTIREGRKNGEFVLQVSASDKDEGPNGEVRYSIEPAYEAYFKIDPTNGVLSAVGNLDRETNPALRFFVYASDQGSPKPRQGSAEISVVLEDVNDNAPEFDRRVFRIKTKEEVEGVRIIGELTAKDYDEGVNGQMQYFFTGSLDGADGAFTVLPNGSIQCSTSLDREERTNYSFSVMVRDKGDPPLMSSASVLVEVTDINDNSPTILFPKSQNHTILISTLPETGVVLSRIIAYDDDAGDNGSLRFTIVSGNEDRAFEITESTGEFKIAQALRLKNKRHYEVGIIVSDRGLPPKFNTSTLRVDVQYDNATAAMIENEQEKQEDYIIIVAVVAAVTIIFSTLIIVAICVVFHKDRTSQRRKPPAKAGFHNLPGPENMSDEEKMNTAVQESSKSGTHQQHYNLNDLSGSLSKPQEEEGNFGQFELSPPPESQGSSKGKAVSFSLEQTEGAAPVSRTLRDLPPSFLTFNSSCVRACEDDVYRQRSHRQVSGVKYEPVSTSGHGDDVTSDTSGDTTTNDSGRGNSVDDVNFDQIVRGEHSPRLTARRRSDELQIPARKLTSSENAGRSSYHVRFAQNSGKVGVSDLPPKPKLSNHYQGARPASKSFSMDFIKDRSSAHNPHPTNSSGAKHSKLSTFGTPRQLSMTSIDDDATTTTSGSYHINPDDIRIDTFVGSDIIV